MYLPRMMNMRAEVDTRTPPPDIQTPDFCPSRFGAFLPSDLARILDVLFAFLRVLAVF